MLKFTCEGHDGMNYLTLETDEMEKFDKVMRLVESMDGEIKSTKPKFSSIYVNLDDYVVHCPTQHAMEILAKSGFMAKHLADWWFFYGKGTCVEMNGQCYGPKEWYKRHHWLILEFDDYDWSEWED